MKPILILIMIITCLTLWAETMDTTWMKAYQLRQKFQFEEASQVLLDYLKDNPESEYKMEVNYTIACNYSLAKKKDLAFKYLKTAVEQGFLESQFIKGDTDFVNLNKDSRWKKQLTLVMKLEQDKIATLPQKHKFLQEIVLPAPKTKGNVSVEEALQNRRSVREYSEQALTLDEVSQILWSAYGVTQVVSPEFLRGGLKTAPSAGATYPLEIYLGAWNVTGLEPGFYLFQPQGHKLQLISKGNFSKELMVACSGQEYAMLAPASLVYSAVYERTTQKYGPRGRERYVPMDLGHSAENVYLQAETLGMGTVAIGYFSDLKLRLIVPMTKEEEPIYVMPIGKKKVTAEK